MSQHLRRALILAYPFPPLAVAGSFRMLRFSRYLPDFGWQPLVMTGETSGVDPASLDETLCDDVPPGLVVRRAGMIRPLHSLAGAARGIVRAGRSSIPMPSPAATGSVLPASAMPTIEKPGLARRAVASVRSVRDLLFAIPDKQIGWFLPAVRSATQLARQQRAEIIFSSSPPASSHLVAIAVRQLTGLPLVIDFRDPWARPHWRSGRRHPLRDRVQQRLERLCVTAAARVVLNTTELRDEFAAYYGPHFEHKFVVVPNGYDPALIEKAARLRSERPIKPSDGTMRLCHPGTVYGHRDLRPIVAAMAQLAQSGRRVILEQVGDLEDPAVLLRCADQHGLRDQVVLTGFLPHRTMLERLAAADVLVVLQPGTSVQVPGKLFEMLPFGRPLLALAESAGATADVVRDYDLGEVASPADETNIAAAIERLAERSARKAIDAGLQAALDAFDGRTLTGALAEILNDCTARQANAVSDDCDPEQSLSDARIPARVL